MKERWPIDEIQKWYEKQPWIVGCNFIPSTAVNQLEMWQEETFDPQTIDRELNIAADTGMNTVRVYLHDLAWESDREGFKARIDAFLHVAHRHGIRMLPVLFDDCWYSTAKPGLQPAPVPGLHNSGWLQSPGTGVATDLSQWPRLKNYVQDIVCTFRDDDRILLWDIYNELGNFFLPVLSQPWFRRIPRLLILLLQFYLLPVKTLPLFREAVQWVRQCDPTQPVTAGVWFNHSKLNRELVAASDIVSFHNYKDADNLAKQIRRLKKYNRPLICTEYMSRTSKSTFKSCMPVFKKENTGCINWGLVSGKTQTIYSWADRGSTEEPEIWFHDIFRPDGSAYNQGEVDFIRKITGVR